MVSVDVEIHYGRTPPRVESVLVSVPQGVAREGCGQATAPLLSWEILS
jgi:hypothetical protein